MPTYVYECSKCSDVFEVDQRITEDALTDCPCGSKGTVKRLIQPVAVMFSGSGFHINDYAPSTSKAETPAKTEEKLDPAPAAETPAPTPPATPKTDNGKPKTEN